MELILYNVGPVTFAQVESAIFSSSSATSAGFDFLAGTVLFAGGVRISWEKWCWKGRNGS